MEEDRDKSKDKVLPALKKMVDSVNSTIEVQTRMAPQTSNQTLIRLQDTVLEFLAISGIEALLPLDCGRVSMFTQSFKSSLLSVMFFAEHILLYGAWMHHVTKISQLGGVRLKLY